MNLILSVIVLSLFLSITTINAQFSITAKFDVTTARYNYGFYTGTLYYDWNMLAMKLVFPQNDEYAELYLFNTARGYTSSVTSSQYGGQYLYKTSINCSCETTTLSFAMPFFAKSQQPFSTYWTPAGSETIKGIVADKFTWAKTTANALITDVWFTSSGNLLGFKMKDSRMFTLDQSTYQTTGFKASVFTAPSGCKCGKPMDVVLSLDRTGSINYEEWLMEKSFTKNISGSFDYGDLKTNLGIINWNKKHWVTLQLTAGTSSTAVATSVEAMGCCAASGCCCCGTDIGGGLFSAGEMLLTSRRPTATKAVILLTDGCQNHRYEETQDPPVIPCSCGTEDACATNAECIDDITRHYRLLKKKVPSAKVIIVGVGDQLCTSQLLLAAGGIQDNVYSTNSWSLLNGLVTSLAATACTVDDDLCTGCCGFCSCGVCITPKQCAAPDKCSEAKPDPAAGGCCTVVPKTCTPKDLCHTTVCDPNQGCVDTPKACRPSQTCTTYECDVADGICKAKPINSPICNPPPTPVTQNNTAPPPPPAVNCRTDGDCDYGDKCIVARCRANECYYNESTKCPTDTQCVSYKCIPPKTGCVVVKNITGTCNDNNLCTIDYCDPQKGCIHDPITCSSPADKCLYTVCLPHLGCVNRTNTCANFTGNCTVGNCYNQSCHADNVCVLPPPPTGTSDDVPPSVVLGSSLGAAALVAIIVCVIIALCGVGGGAAFAISQAGAGGGAASTQVNPLYKASGHSGQNPLYRA
eukprot:TRINITY_DN1_c0_g1_i1.p1 TRINITY_DN1_c0_g1~~TRINITY_DN1_c0_g1_i1.p1  ORF type:complete len:750 (-),score=199.29 TRINITY_DN1_c0_g1_i1:262-2511(-)